MSLTTVCFSLFDCILQFIIIYFIFGCTWWCSESFPGGAPGDYVKCWEWNWVSSTQGKCPTSVLSLLPQSKFSVAPLWRKTRNSKVLS